MPRDRPEGDPGPSLVLFAYGLCIMMVGALAFNEASMSNAALSSIFVSNGAAVFVFACAAAVREHGRVAKGDPKYLEYMIGIHLGVALPVLFAFVCGFRGYKAFINPDKRYVAKYMLVNVVASLVTVFYMLRFRKERAVAQAADDAPKGPDAVKTSIAKAASKSKSKGGKSKGGKSKAN